MPVEDFKISVGLSRHWDARKAGREVAYNTLEKLGTDPDFFLLFSTIHYEKWGGFKEFLAGVWDVLPEGTPLIGGTVAGFIIPQGCFVRGATALAVSYPNMDVAVGIGRNTKRNPKKAAKQCANMVKERLKKSNYKNKFLFELISGPIFPIMPFKGRIKMVKNRVLSLPIAYIAQISTFLLQKGAGREVEVLQELSKQLSDFYILGGSSMDNYKYVSNYQFFNKKVYTNVIVALGIQTDMNPYLKTAHGLIETGEKWEITKDAVWKHMICNLNGKPAVEGYLRATGWPKEILDERVHTKTIFYPLGILEDDGFINPCVIAAFIGDYLNIAFTATSNNLSLLTTSGRRLIDAVDETLSSAPMDSSMIFSVSCGVRIEALGDEINITKEKIESRFNKPFLVIYTSGEDVYIPQKGNPHHMQETFNLFTLF